MIKTLITRALLGLMVLLAMVNVNVQAVYGSSLSNSARRFALSPALRQVAMPTTRALTSTLRLEAASTFARSATTTPHLHTSPMSSILNNSKPTFISPKQTNLPITQELISKQSKSGKWKKIAGILGALGITGGITIGLMKDEIKKIIENAKVINSIDAFEQDIISDDITNAIVRIYKGIPSKFSPKGFIPIAGEVGSAIIVRGKNTDALYVITVAHCMIEDARREGNYIQLRSNGLDGWVPVEPILIDLKHDIAVLLIHPGFVTQFQNVTKSSIPSITADYLSSAIPEKYDAVSLQGYPAFLSKDALKPHAVTVAALTKYGLIDNDGNKVPSFHSAQLEQGLAGASGGPIIAIRDKKPAIVGLIHGGMKPNDSSTYVAVSTSLGKLPGYLHATEERMKAQSAQTVESAAQSQ